MTTKIYTEKTVGFQVGDRVSSEITGVIKSISLNDNGVLVDWADSPLGRVIAQCSTVGLKLIGRPEKYKVTIDGEEREVSEDVYEKIRGLV